METDQFWIAEFNIARLKAPLDSPVMKEFVDFLAPVNRFGEESPGFILRLAAPDAFTFQKSFDSQGRLLA